MAISMPALVQRFSVDSSGAVGGIRKVEAQFGKMGVAAQKVGTSMTKFVTLPILAIGAAATKLAMDFDDAMARIIGLAGQSEQQVAEWGDAVLDLAGKVGIAPQELAEALYFVSSSGIEASKAMDVVTASAQAASAGLGDTVVIADTVTSVLNAYGAETITAARATSTLVAAVRAGKAEPAELAGALGRVVPIAATLGVEFHQVAAAVAAMSISGLDAAEGVTALRGIMSTLASGGTSEATDFLESVGLSMQGLRDQVRGPGGLPALLKTLDGAFRGNEEAASMLFGNIRALTGVLNLTGPAAARVNGIFADLANTTDEDLRVAFEAVQDTAKFKMKAAFASVSADLIKIGRVVAPLAADAMRFLAATFSGVVGAFRSLPAPAKTALGIFVAVAALVGPLAILTLKLAKAFMLLKGVWAVMQVSGLVGGIRALAAAESVAAAAATANAAAQTASSGAMIAAAAAARLLSTALAIASAAYAGGLVGLKAYDKFRNPFTKKGGVFDTSVDTVKRSAREMVKGTGVAADAIEKELDGLADKARAGGQGAMEALIDALGNPDVPKTIQSIARSGGDVVVAMRAMADGATPAAARVAAGMYRIDEATGEVTVAAQEAATAVKDLGSALDEALGRELDVTDSTIAYKDALVDLRDAAKGVPKSQRVANGELATGTAKQRAFSGAVTDTIRSYSTWAQAVATGEGRGDDAARVTELMTQRFRDLAKIMPELKPVLRDYLADLETVDGVPDLELTPTVKKDKAAQTGKDAAAAAQAGADGKPVVIPVSAAPAVGPLTKAQLEAARGQAPAPAAAPIAPPVIPTVDEVALTAARAAVLKGLTGITVDVAVHGQAPVFRYVARAVKPGESATFAPSISYRKFHQGGVVPGPPTREQLALLRGGEVVRTRQQAKTRGGNGALRIISGRLTIDDEGRGTLRDVIAEEMEEDAAYRAGLTRMQR